MNGPCVAGATGGSGTRVVARLMQNAGTFIGTRLNDSEDAIEVGLFLNQWIPPYIASVHRGLPMDPTLVTAMAGQWTLASARHLDESFEAGQPYGWKEPRSLYLLPFWHARYPSLRFLHLVRDGRDMAFSQNQNQLRLYGALMLPRETDPLPAPVRSIALWSKLNLWAADYGEKHMTGQYLRIRFEDLCATPAEVARRVLAFFGLRDSTGHAITAEIVMPPSAGRWRITPPELLRSVSAAGESALDRFGYR